MNDQYQDQGLDRAIGEAEAEGEHTEKLRATEPTPRPWGRSPLASDAIIGLASSIDLEQHRYYGGDVVCESCHMPDQELILAAVNEHGKRTDFAAFCVAGVEAGLREMVRPLRMCHSYDAAKCHPECPHEWACKWLDGMSYAAVTEDYHRTMARELAEEATS